MKYRDFSIHLSENGSLTIEGSLIWSTITKKPKAEIFLIFREFSPKNGLTSKSHATGRQKGKTRDEGIIFVEVDYFREKIISGAREKKCRVWPICCGICFGQTI